MKKKFYHGCEMDSANKILDSGYINAGCICDDKMRSVVYAGDIGFVFTIYDDWSIWQIIKLFINRALLKIFENNEVASEWLYDRGIVPHTCDEYINMPGVITENERRFKYIKAEMVEKIYEKKHGFTVETTVVDGEPVEEIEVFDEMQTQRLSNTSRRLVCLQ